MALERPVHYVCALCRMGSPRAAASRLAGLLRRQKAATVAGRPQGARERVDPASQPLGHAEVGP